MKLLIFLLIQVFLVIGQQEGDLTLVDEFAEIPDQISECLDPNERFVCGFGEIDVFNINKMESKCVWR